MFAFILAAFLLGVTVFVNLFVFYFILGGIAGTCACLVALAIKFGVAITRHKFSVSGYHYRVVDFMYPLHTKDNRRVISDDNNRYVLSALYTNRKDVWAYFDSIRTLLITNPAKRFHRALIIGGGGCTVPYTLARDYPKVRIDVVEISRKKIEIAQKYFLKGEFSDRIRTMVQDGTIFVKTITQPYDFVFVDVYNGNVIPNSVKSEKFIKSLKKAITSQGLIFINLSCDENVDLSQFITLYRFYFPNFRLYNNGKTTIGIIYNKNRYNYPGLRIM